MYYAKEVNHIKMIFFSNFTFELTIILN